MPLNVINMLMPKFIGSVIDGVNTSTRQRIKNTYGIIILTLIGRGASGLKFYGSLNNFSLFINNLFTDLVFLIHINPKTQAAIDSHKA